MAHIQGKASQRSRLAGTGGLISSHLAPPPRPPHRASASTTLDRSLSPGAAVSRPLFRPPEADSDDPDADDDDAFEPVEASSARVTPGGAPPHPDGGHHSLAQGRSRISHLPPPPKKRQKTLATTLEAEGDQDEDDGGAVAGGGRGRGRGRGRGGAAGRARGKGRAKTDRETMERLLDPAVDFPEHFVRLEKAFKVRLALSLSRALL